ncbi:hypothetical protein D3C78_1982150 [compost metagenome]
MDHGVRRRQVQAYAPCLEADQEHFAFTSLELLHWRATVASITGQQAVTDFALLKLLLDQRQHRGEL